MAFDQARHEPLAGAPWSDSVARSDFAELIADLCASCRGDRLLWPNHPADLEGDPDEPMRTLYLGAGGIVWALARLAAGDHGDVTIDLRSLATDMVEGWRVAPEFTALYPPFQPSLLMGESGLLALGEALSPDAAGRDRLADCIAANAAHPARELLWGSPGTMLVAVDMARRTGEERWAELWRASAHWLLEDWRAEIWEQDLYGRRAAYVGAGHGFAGNVHALLRGRHLLELSAAEDVERRAVAVLERLAERDGAWVQWPALLGADAGPPRVQWCHGAAGIVIALGGLLGPDPAVDELLVGAGELTWQAGPPRASAGLCHGTAGNGYAFLRLYARIGDERWLDRARAFAMHALQQRRALAVASGHERWTLFTGNAGLALFVAACIDGEPAFPVLDDVLPC